jgi:hypothetical protein
MGVDQMLGNRSWLQEREVRKLVSKRLSAMFGGVFCMFALFAANPLNLNLPP